ncbi:MAG: PTS sugar transporter subunit IIA [Bradyrhizobium sp.]
MVPARHLPALSRSPGAVMTISDFLSPNDVMVDVRAPDKRQLLRELARKAAVALDLPAYQIAAELLKREELGSTGTGGGIAIPHARMQGVTKPFGILAKLRQPIDFDAIDGHPVDLVFVLLLPADPKGEQLGALACVARKLREPAAVVRMREAKDPAGLYAAISE